MSMNTDLIREYARTFSWIYNRVWGKICEYGGKKVELSKQVYLLNRYSRVTPRCENKSFRKYFKYLSEFQGSVECHRGDDHQSQCYPS